MPHTDVEIPGHLRRYLVDDERLVVAVRRHPAVIVMPALTTVLALVLAIYVSINAPGLANVIWLIWLVVLGRAVILFWLWWSDWFAATSSRLLLTYGIIQKKVAMMPLTKVTDMSYNRSIPGRILGYGQFVMESAGQDQALREVNFLPQPDELYRKIIGEIFHKKPTVSRAPLPIALHRGARSVRSTTSSDEPAPWENEARAAGVQFPRHQTRRSRPRNTVRIRRPDFDQVIAADPSEDD